jgi:GNAT superfamily N-acetyltransferase
MKKLITAGLSLSAVLTALGEVKAYVNYPWCIIGNTRGIDCVFSSREQCAEDGRNRGFGGQCIKNPNYDPKKGPVVNSGIMLNSLGQPLHNPAEAPLIRGTQRKKPNQDRQK